MVNKVKTSGMLDWHAHTSQFCRRKCIGLKASPLPSGSLRRFARFLLWRRRLLADLLAFWQLFVLHNDTLIHSGVSLNPVFLAHNSSLSFKVRRSTFPDNRFLTGRRKNPAPREFS